MSKAGKMPVRGCLGTKKRLGPSAASTVLYKKINLAQEIWFRIFEVWTFRLHEITSVSFRNRRGP